MTRTKIKFESTFSRLAEQATERFQQGGYINGDYVRLSKSIKTSQHYKGLPKQTQEKIDGILASDLHLRVSAIKSIRPAGYSNDGSPNAAADYFVDVVQEYAPGLYKDPLTLPICCIELVDTADAMGRMPPPDSQVYKANIHGAEEVTTKDDDRSLPKKNTKIAGGNKWVNAPIGGGGNGMKKLKTEAYQDVITQLQDTLDRFEETAAEQADAYGHPDVDEVYQSLINSGIDEALADLETMFTDRDGGEVDLRPYMDRLKDELEQMGFHNQNVPVRESRKASTMNDEWLLAEAYSRVKRN